ncbi:eukaryotic translation initiation factor 2-alpha kinase 1 [Orussus abietinus]|uniref:eukaryotic translation initiation factor 2-alpha kinase 1 n=1 Tax=Orussus abietinus TaxID=222816 RepID=UPI000626CBC0|nr:eukaryotic translation initiation factor 2-alpha kinase 1 [Orussus abietinus]
MDEERLKNNNPWTNLSTLTTFDRGNDAWISHCTQKAAQIQTGGEIVRRVFPSTSFLIESLIQQLCVMFEEDSVRRKRLYIKICNKLHQMKLIDGSYNMAEFDTIRSQYQTALCQLVSVARASTGSDNALGLSGLMFGWSRYCREFEEIEFIARGGFGCVYKALHRLDDTEYAIKKIVVEYSRMNTIVQHLEEVKTIAKLNHMNIVPYKNAWIEMAFPSTFGPNVVSYEQSNRDQLQPSSENNKQADYYLTNHRMLSSSISQSLEENSFHMRQQTVENNQSQQTEEMNSDVVSFKSSSNRNNIFSHFKQQESLVTNSNDSESEEESVNDGQLCPYNSGKNIQYVTLYIQMALCEKTLRQWLDKRQDFTPQSVISSIFTQIIRGLEYIHSLDIVHHDIKPSNIFVSSSGRLQVQLGDFGLACPLQGGTHYSAIGTQMYAAPEQLQGKCSSKSDIYSSGIVLLELLIPMQTKMECSRTVDAFKNGQIPTTLTARYPKWASLVSRLIQFDPNNRPSTHELLRELSDDKDSIISRLKSDNEEKNVTIRNLQDQVERLEARISELTFCSSTQ